METEVISIFLVIFIFIDIKQKIRFEENMKNIYTQMVNNEIQKSHPFGQSEKRFNWINNYSNGNDLKKHKKIERKKDNLPNPQSPIPNPQSPKRIIYNYKF